MLSDNLLQIEWISPTVFITLHKCFLKGTWMANRKPSPLPSRPEAYLGQIIHYMCEIASKGRMTSIDDFDFIWETKLGTIEKNLIESSSGSDLIPLNEKIQNYEYKKELSRISVANILKKRYNTEKKDFGLYQVSEEVHLKNSAMLINGVVDLIIEREGYIEIVDYKTGTIYETTNVDKKIKKDLITQMHFYAGLYFYCKNTWPTKLTLITKTGEYQKIDYTYEHSVQLITSAQCMMFTINTVINNSSISETKKQELLARPSPKTCYFCEYRPDCIEYINQRISNEHQNWPIDKFLLIEKIDPQKNNKVIITGTELASNKKVRVLGIPFEKIKESIMCGDKTALFSLKCHCKSDERYDWQYDSAIQSIQIMR